MDSFARLFVLVGTVAIVALLGGIAYFIKWEGPSFAAGILAGLAIFAGGYKAKYGKWP